jgi:hypothetical protein
MTALTADDRALINDAVARYNRGIDTLNRAEFLSVFTDDAVWISKMMGTFASRKGLDRFFTEFCEREDYALFRGGQHWVANAIITQTADDQVDMWSNFAYFVHTPAGPLLVILGEYEDVLVKQPSGAWLFKVRDIRITSNAYADRRDASVAT